MKKIKPRYFIIGSLLFFSVAWAAQSYLISVGTYSDIDEWGAKRRVTNVCSAAIFVPTNSSAEWTAFQNNKPNCVTVSPATWGYIVRTNATFSSNMGGLAGADNLCLNDLTNFNWLNKSNAVSRGLLNAAHVFALLCDNSTCRNPFPNTQYIFARTGTTAVGNDSLYTDSYLYAPQYSGSLSSNIKFGSGTYWTGRAAGPSALNWGLNPSGASCSNWSAGGGVGTVGKSTESEHGRFSFSNESCASAYNLICVVNP